MLITDPGAPRKVEHLVQGPKTVVDCRGMDHDFVMDQLKQAIQGVGERP